VAAPAWAAALQRHWWRPRPSGLARLLQPLSWVYRLLAWAARLPYATGLRHAPVLPVPVIVVGNLVVGGAGKTPTVIALLHRLRAEGWTPGVISRGYGRDDDALREVDSATSPTQAGDEPVLIHRRTGMPVVVGRDRVAAARELLARHPEVDLIVSDDGLQHHRLHRDLALIVFDERGAGNGLLLPAGPLRTPLPPRLPPDSWVLYNAPAATTPLPGSVLRRGLGGAVPLGDWHRGMPARPDALDALRGRALIAVAGIAAPDRFFAMLDARGLAVTRVPMPDHDPYATLPWPADAADVVITEKDAVKIAPGRIGTTRVWVVTLDFGFDPAFEAALLAGVRSLRKASR
jgi:tetraacyldisaccharide 4'-kinase